MHLVIHYKYTGDLLQKVSRTNASEELSYSCVAWGAYVGEVVHKEFDGGKWSEKGGANGAFELGIDGGTVYPCRWISDRVEKGASASVWKRCRDFELERSSRDLGTTNNAGLDR